MRYGSLCSGIGGLDLAVEAVFGAEPAWFCESDVHAASVLAAHWPGIPVYPDLRTQDWSDVEPVEVVCAGYPCQPFSVAGRRRGESDPRHLWPDVIRAVRVLRPRFVVLENVAGHLRLGFDRVLGDLAEAGFDAEWATVRASDVGAPHRRERLFVVAHTADGVHGDGRGGVAGSSSRGERTTPRDGGRPVAGDEVVAYPGGERFGEHTGEPSTEETGTHEGHAASGDGSGTAVAHSAGERRRRQIEPRQDVEHDGLQPSFMGAAPPDAAGIGRERGGGSRRGGGGLENCDSATPPDADRVVRATTLAVGGRPGPVGEPGTLERPERLHCMDWGDYGPAVERWGQLLERPAPSPTDDGRLAVPFVEWMMGFPEGWVDGLSRTAALRCLGNAVVPQQGALALEWLTA